MNPFDQFAGTLQAALPPQPSGGASVAPSVASSGQPQQQQQQQQQQQMMVQQPPVFNLMAQPTQEKKPVMNAPGMMPPQQQQQQQVGGMVGGGMYGQPPPQQQGGGMYGQPPGGMYGQPQPPQPQQPSRSMMMPTNSMTGGFGMGSSGSMPPAQAPGNNGFVPPLQGGGGPPPPNPTPNAMAGALVPSGVQSNPYALGPPAPAAGPPGGTANPFGAPAQLGAPPPQQQQQQQQQQMVNANPFGGPGGPPPPGSNPFGPPAALGAPPQANPAAMDPFAAPSSAAPLLAADPWGAPAQPGPGAMVPSAALPGDDPFGVFGTGPPVDAAPGASAVGAPPSVHPSGAPPGGPPPWSEMGFGSPAVPPAAAPAPSGPVPGEDDVLFGAGLQPTRDEENGSARGPKPASPPKASPSGGKGRQKGKLPPGGEWYDAKIFTPTLGVMFFKPKELVDSLFLQTDKKLVDMLDERPVVAFIVEGSSARSAGVELGHVLLKVNGIDVKNPKEASRLIKEGPRPLPLLFYVPETSVVVAEGEHMVKYNSKDTGAPNSAKDWKPKYVVIGGIIAQPWMMNMYRSKSEYDIAVIETQARRPVSVKVKQFSLQGARVQNDWQGPQMVKYKNKLHPWKYIVILPISRNPIKIASPNLSQLKPVHEGIRRVLQAQQRDRGGGGHRATPQRGPDQYSNRAPAGAGGGYDTREQHGQRTGDHGGNSSPAGAYYGGRPSNQRY
eukprot:CAMPEP_0181118794 /NCGR_PEP_ID=MMETSP1071-20121207/23268_1 /TAXON_ID=35127 /ORGANISM="Thalassiosira sp., Strain NH16" /LENGTH=722 /DNA_ID=CAMNT_0023203317 /DNA_START=109 /DNA_END=2278 /DNA_ORIENTATION=-